MEKWNKPLMTFSGLDSFIDDLLEARGIEDIDAFLSVSSKRLHNPYKMKDMKKAVERIIAAVVNKEKIGILGDYDCDGVSSTSLWLIVLEELGADVVYFIPDRHKDGYGVGRRGVDFMKNNGVKLVITCDTGITAVKYTHEMMQDGIDVIITDHHEPKLTESYPENEIPLGLEVKEFLIPKCIAVVNMKRPDCSYPFKGLAGVGVSFKVLCAVAEKLHPRKRKLVYDYFDIVALGTVADMMDIIDENRAICYRGMKQLNNTKNKGVYQLIRANELKDKELTTRDIGWTLAPCINAAGRIVTAEQAVDMVLCKNRLDAYRYATELVEINKSRKELTKVYVDNIIKSIEADAGDESIIVHYYPGIPEGIVGLIAGRVMNHFNKPCLILSDTDKPTLIKGSGRSVPALNLFETLLHYTDLIDFGGHHAACGLSLDKANLPQFKDSIQFYVSTLLTTRDLEKQTHVDCLIKPQDVDMELMEELKYLEPFGAGNQAPMFQMDDVFVMKEKPVGKDGEHLWMLVKAGGKVFSTIGFFLYAKYDEISKPRNVSVLFRPDINEYPKGKFNVQLKIEDIRKG